MPRRGGLGRRRRHDEFGFARGNLLEFIFFDQPRPLGSESDDDALLLLALDVALEVAADAIPNANEGEGLFVEDVPSGRGQVNQALGQFVIVLLLLDGVVECRVSQILIPIGNQEGLQLHRMAHMRRVKGSE